MKNLEAEMRRYGVTVRDICSATGIKQERTARYKISGTHPFSLPQAFKIRDTFFPGMDLEYLFSTDATPAPQQRAG